MAYSSTRYFAAAPVLVPASREQEDTHDACMMHDDVLNSQAAELLRGLLTCALLR